MGTPGKIVDLLKKGAINPQTIKCCVVDEADTVVEEGGFRVCCDTWQGDIITMLSNNHGLIAGNTMEGKPCFWQTHTT